jgi:hypothetical protein
MFKGFSFEFCLEKSTSDDSIENCITYKLNHFLKIRASNFISLKISPFFNYDINVMVLLYCSKK